jgi:A/G-specific adenine glycosylase
VTVPRIRQLASVQRVLLDWHGKHGLRAPWRESRDPYHCLVAAVMAQQTQMSRVMPSYERFVAHYPTLDSLAAATLGDVIRVWAGMGYNQRAVRLHRAARQIAAHGWPPDTESLVEIDGIGAFTAAIIASFAFGQPSACVDTNVRRVLGRLAGDEDLSAARLQQLADASMAGTAPARWNQAVMDFGAGVCRTRPKCGECVVARWCASRSQFTEPLERVAEQRPAYHAAPRRKRREPAYEGSARYYRGRIIDALCQLSAGESLTLRGLNRQLGAMAPDEAELLQLVDVLAGQGLVMRTRGRIALPG